jgi:protein phosphatase
LGIDGRPCRIIAALFLEVDVSDECTVEQASRWLEELTGKRGEGMAVKPLDLIARGPKSLAQPAIKCRGREYLRIIYGPEYNADDQLPGLRSRGLSGKRSLVQYWFSLMLPMLVSSRVRPLGCRPVRGAAGNGKGAGISRFLRFSESDHDLL